MIGEDYDEDVRGPLYQYLFTEKHPSKKLDRVKELLVEKFNYLKDTVRNNKRQTVYAVLTTGSGGGGYVLSANTPFPVNILFPVVCSTVTMSACGIHDCFQRK